MTREEAIYCMKSYIDDPNYEHCTSCPYYGANQIGENVFVCNSGEAHKMAVEALEQEPCENEYIKVPKKALKYRTAGMIAYNAEWLKNHFDIERAVICGEQEKGGRWIRELIRNEHGGCIGARMICSKCGQDNGYDKRMKFCPNCGKKMEVDNEEA